VEAEALVPLFKLVTGRLPVTWVERFTPVNVPASVKLPELVTVPDNEIPFTVPVPPTEVTVPPPLPAPIAVLNDAASKVVTVLSALICMNVTALGLASVNRLLPTVVEPKEVRAVEADVPPVPPEVNGRAVPNAKEAK
jgi:hypothetical protein